MDNNENNSNFSPLSDSLNKSAKEVKNNLKFSTIDSEELLKPYRDIGKKLAKAMLGLFTSLNTDFFKELRKYIKAFSDNVLIEKLQLMGAFEWCCIDEKIVLSNRYKSEYGEDVRLSVIVIDKLKSNDCSALDIDRFIGNFFSSDIVKVLEGETTSYIDESDKKKLNRAMIAFRGRRYLESASLLASLIDAQSIKQELFDITNGRYHVDNTDKNNNPNISQGWKAFYIVFCNNFSKYFNNEVFNGSGKKEKREKGMKDFLNGIKGSIPNDDTIVSIVALSLCLLNFFDDSEWQNYPDNKPTVINRHWLMHGMYDIDDITRYDCIKLLLMLNQLTKLYSKLKKGEL